MDFTKFDITKFFNLESMIGNIEKQTMTAISFIPEQAGRKVVETLSTASIDFARAQVAAATAYGAAVQKSFAFKA